ncbi:MAG: Gldg family protein [Planctomycetota bacterium]|jgi:ABC-type uncharacterized transport system involved in gliding motility auxiliary subunit
MATRNQSILSLSRLGALLLLVLLVLVNAVFARTTMRLDLTEEGIYTLAPGSQRILASLEDPATLKVFWHDVPENGETQRRYLDSLLDEMRAAARGKLTVRWVDMDDEAGKQEAVEAGVQETPFQALVEGEVRFKRGYDSLVVETGDQKEVIPHLVNMGPQLEYELISKIHRMSAMGEAVVGLVSPQPAAMNPFQPQAQGRFRYIEQTLQAQFEGGARTFVTLDEPVAPDIGVLLVVAPEDLEEEAVFNLEQFVLRGGKLLLYLDPVHEQVLRQPSPRPMSSGLEEWLAHLGITAESGVVGDFQYMTSYPRPVTIGGMQMNELVEYPYWVLLMAEFMNEENPATRGFGQIPLYWPVSISLDAEKQEAAGREATLLASSSDYGYPRPDLIGITQGTGDDGITRDDLRVVPLMVMIEGPMESFWKGRRPPGEEEPEDADAEDAPPPGEEEPAVGSGSPDGDDEGAEAEPVVGSGDPDGDAEPPAEAPDPGEGEPGEGAGDAPPAGGADDEGDRPEDETDPDEAEADETEEAEESGPAFLEAGSGLIVVLGDAELIDDRAAYFGQRIGRGYDNGFPFTQNILEWMSGSEDLLSLRARDRKPRIIEDTDASQKDLIKWANFLGMPLLIFLAGMVVFIVRRYQK